MHMLFGNMRNCAQKRFVEQCQNSRFTRRKLIKKEIDTHNMFAGVMLLKASINHYFSKLSPNAQILIKINPTLLPGKNNLKSNKEKINEYLGQLFLVIKRKVYLILNI